MAATSSLKTLSSVRAFGGQLNRYEHLSQTLGALPMKFAVFVPDSTNKVVPTLYYLSGLTCTDENVSQKGCIAFRYLQEKQMAMVMPDTSPRNHPEIPTENDSYDFGTGAGFYLNATTPNFSTNYKMYDYIVFELPKLMEQNFPWYSSSSIAITGHSMGGHGALTIGLKNPSLYKSVSAFSPICNPSNVPWGEKAFKGYLANPEQERLDYDTVELLKKKCTHPMPLLVDQGTKDNFYTGDVNQLMPAELEKACAEAGQALEMRYREGYDHSYWFISSYIGEHVEWHAKMMG